MAFASAGEMRLRSASWMTDWKLYDKLVTCDLKGDRTPIRIRKF